MTFIESEHSRDEDDEISEDLDEVNELTKKHSLRAISVLRRGSVFSKTFDPEDENDLDKLYQVNDQTNESDYDVIQNRQFDSLLKDKTFEQREKLFKIISSIVIFKHLYEDDINELIDSMFERRCKKSEEIIREGDNGNYFYVIISGTYDAYIKDIKNKDIDDKYGRKVREYKDAGYFGELALLYDQPRLATIVVKEDGILYCMNRDKFKRLVIGSEFKRRKLYEEFLESVPLLKSSMNKYERSQVADALLTKTFKRGETVFKQDDKDANGMYFIESGKVKIVRNETGNEIILKILNIGEYFGELALVNKAPRSASAIVYDDECSSSPCKLAFLDIDAFERLMGPCIELIKKNMSIYRDLDSSI